MNGLLLNLSLDNKHFRFKYTCLMCLPCHLFVDVINLNERRHFSLRERRKKTTTREMQIGDERLF